MDISEENISRKKEKTLSKHFDILIDGKKVKVVNYIIKNYKKGNEAGQVIELISKYKLNMEFKKKVKINISEKNESIEIDGYLETAHYGPGNFHVTYWITFLNTTINN